MVQGFIWFSHKGIVNKTSSCIIGPWDIMKEENMVNMSTITLPCFNSQPFSSPFNASSWTKYTFVTPSKLSQLLDILPCHLYSSFVKFPSNCIHLLTSSNQLFAWKTDILGTILLTLSHLPFHKNPSSLHVLLFPSQYFSSHYVILPPLFLWSS